MTNSNQLTDELKGFTIEQLQAEINRKMLLAKHRPVPAPEFDKIPVLKAVLESIIQKIIDGEFNYGDEAEIHALVYDATMSTAFGKDIFDWIDDNISG